MTILSKLTLSDKTKVAMLTSPEAKLRGKMLEALDLQMEAAKATLNGETYIRRTMRWVKDPETGERFRKEVPVRSRLWFWKDEQRHQGRASWVGRAGSACARWFRRAPYVRPRRAGRRRPRCGS